MTWLPNGAGRLDSPLGDRREKEVRCGGRYGCRNFTWAWDGACDSCHELVCDCPIDADGIPTCQPEASAESWEAKAG